MVELLGCGKLSMLQIWEEHETWWSRSLFLQGTVYFLLAVSAFISCVAFIVTRRRCFLYLAIASIVSIGTYLGFFRTRMRKKFNIRESRTLEMNNVQGGTWHGRSDTICVGAFGEGGKAFVELHPHFQSQHNSTRLMVLRQVMMIQATNVELKTSAQTMSQNSNCKTRNTC
ncbi:Spermidine/putrescine import ATP-binding protein PotA [Bienertia sinuspersici]